MFRNRSTIWIFYYLCLEAKSEMNRRNLTLNHSTFATNHPQESAVGAVLIMNLSNSLAAKSIAIFINCSNLRFFSSGGTLRGSGNDFRMSAGSVQVSNSKCLEMRCQEICHQGLK